MKKNMEGRFVVGAQMIYREAQQVDTSLAGFRYISDCRALDEL